MMASKRARSLSPHGTDTAASTTSTIDHEINTPTKYNPLPMPPFDTATPMKWLCDMEKWFKASNITDSWLKFSLLATTQTPSGYAILKADLRALSHLDAYELACSHILRQNRCDNPDADEFSANPSTPMENENLRNDNRDIVADTSVQVTVPLATETVSTPSVTAAHESNEMAQPLQQLEAMLLGEIRAIKFDIAELRALQPNRRRQPRSDTNTHTNANDTNQSTTQERSDEIVADGNPADCWYHQTYGRQARLCRAPCRYRSP